MKVKQFLEDVTIIKDDSQKNIPEISVIMPTYCRGESHLRRAIESVLKQTFEDFEFIIVDDGSRDNTFEILKEYQAKDSRIIIVRHELNSGLPGLRVNEGIMMARGKYIAYQFDDDEYIATGLASLYDRISQEDKSCVVYGNCKLSILHENGEITTRLLGNREFNYGILKNGNYIANNAVMHHKEVVNVSGLYDPNVVIRRLCDYDLWLRMAKRVPFIWLDEVVTKVYAGEKHSLGADITISSLSILRRYIEIDRDEKLLPSNIKEYRIDGLVSYREVFSQEDIDYLNRYEVIPFFSKSTYLLDEEKKKTFALTTSKKKKVLVTKSDYSTSIDVTLKNYLCKIPEFPYTYYFLSDRDVLATNPKDYDVCVLYRTISPQANTLLERNKVAQIPVAYFMDDNMFKFHELGDQYRYLATDSVGYKNLQLQIKNSDYIVSYNPIITKDCKEYTDQIGELNTNLPIKYLQKKEFIEKDIIKIGVFSGPVRTKEFEFLWPVLQKLSKKYKDKIEIEFWGINPNDIGDPLLCKMEFKPYTHSYELYLDALKKNSFDYHICPLFGELDVAKSKSPVKFLEGTVCGSIGLFSDVMPYDRLPESVCIKTKNDLDSWYDSIEKAILMDARERYAIYEKAFKYVKQYYSTEAQVYDVVSAFEATQLHANLRGKKIAYMFHESCLGGATLHLFRHAMLLKSIGAQIKLCLPEVQRGIDELPNYVNAYGFDIHYLPYRIYTSPTNFEQDNMKDAQVIAQWLKENNIGMIHEATFVPTIGLAAKLAGIPNIATLHQYYAAPDNSFTQSKCNIHAIHSSSNRYASIWEKVVGAPTRRIVCPVGIEYFDAFSSNQLLIKQKVKNQQVINILVSGTLQPRKNQLEAIKTIKILRDKGYNVELDLIGYDNLVKDYVEQCHDEIAKESLQSFVRIHGFTNKPEEYYKGRANVLLCCSIDESMPQTILQAMAAGLYVVTTTAGGVTEIIKDNYNGIITNGYMAEELAEGIERLLTFNEQHKEDILNNAYDTISVIGHPRFVKSELIGLYNLGFEAFKQKNNIIDNEVFNLESPVQDVKLEVVEPKYVIQPLDDEGIQSIKIKKVKLCKTKTYMFFAKQSNLVGIEVKLNPKVNKIVSGVLIVEIVSPAKKDYIIRKAEVQIMGIKDKESIQLYFEPLKTEIGQIIMIKLNFASDKGTLGIYEYIKKSDTNKGLIDCKLVGNAIYKEIN